MRIRWFLKSAGALHGRRISWEGWTGRNLSLFPMFTPAGTVTDLLVIASDRKGFLRPPRTLHGQDVRPSPTPLSRQFDASLYFPVST